MPTRDSAPIGAPCWVDVFTNDADAARSFYGELFGWTAENGGPELGGYTTFSLDGVPVAGLMGNADPAHPADFWSIHLAVEDAAASVEAATAAGGTLILAPMPVGEIGHMAMVADPSGAAVGMWQPAPFQGFGVLAEDGAPSWFELHTMGYDAALAFYREVFGWDTTTMSDIPEFRYTNAVDGDQELAGVMDDAVHSPEGSPSFWTVYFGVPDADAAAAQVVELGGAIEMAPEDTPYGRLSVVSDVTGSRFSMIQANR